MLAKNAGVVLLPHLLALGLLVATLGVGAYVTVNSNLNLNSSAGNRYQACTQRVNENFNNDPGTQNWIRSSGNAFNSGELVQTVRRQGVSAWFSVDKRYRGDVRATSTVNGMSFANDAPGSAFAILQFWHDEQNSLSVGVRKANSTYTARIYAESNGVVQTTPAADITLADPSQKPVRLILSRQGSKATFSVVQDGQRKDLGSIENVFTKPVSVGVDTMTFNNTENKNLTARFANLNVSCPLDNTSGEE